MIWTENYVSGPHDADVNGVLSASAVMRFMQETAHRYFRANPPSLDDLIDRGMSYVLSKCGMSVYRPLHAYDELKVETWACPSRGPAFNRCYRMYRDGIIVAEMTSVWALLRFADHKLLRAEEAGIVYETEPPLELELPRRIRLPAESLAIVGERAICYSDLDRNGHMNNTKYPDFLCDYLPDMRGKRVLSIVLHFMNEAAGGENVKIYGAENEGAYYFRTVRHDGSTGIEAEIILDDIY